MALSDKRRLTQWTAQYLAAGELSRRGYMVTFTIGNMPAVDLMVGSSTVQFCVDVKGLASDTAWHLTPKMPMKHLYYILVRVASSTEQRKGIRDRFFVLSQGAANKLVAKYEKEHPDDRRRARGFGWRDPFDYEGRWDCLPPASR